MNRAHSYYKEGMKKDALADFNRVVVLDKENADVYYYIAFLFTDLHRLVRIIAQFTV